MQCQVLLLSQRKVSNLVAYCIAYELEDTLSSVTNAHRIDVINQPFTDFSRRAYKILRLASGSHKLARQLAPTPRKKVAVDTRYDLFFPVFNNAYELYSLLTIPDWRNRCSKAACFITEVWADHIPLYLIELLSSFDHVFVGCEHAAPFIARITGRPCTYLPLAADVIRFAPPPNQPRPIQICNIGRRSQVTHKALLDLGDRASFYYYDTVAPSGADLKHRTFDVENAAEHRRMLATLLKHSRYYIANRSYVNRPEFTAGRDEISSRYYEGAAAGTVMIGEAPRTEPFKQQFDWQDAIIHLPFDSPDVGRVLSELNNNPERLRSIQRNNAQQAALKHDWLHRIEVVFDILDLPFTDAMKDRAAQLDAIAFQYALSLRSA